MLNYDDFLSNLKVTFKFIGLVSLSIAMLVIFDSIMEEDYSNIFIPLYFLAFSPVVAFGVAIYSILKKSSFNKFLCSILFSLSVTTAIITFHLLGEYLETAEVDFGFTFRMSIIILVTLIGIYFQLPWKQDNDV